MKKSIVFVLCMVLGLGACFSLTGCNKDSGFTREKAAVVIADSLGFTGGDEAQIIRDYGKNSPSYAKVLACVSRGIFDEAGKNYSFRPSDRVTRYELAKISLYALAALERQEVYYLEPGGERTVKDIEKLSVEQKWFVFGALEYGFVETDASGMFRPDEAVTKEQLEDTLDKVKAAAKGKTGGDYVAYTNAKLQNFHVSPKSDAPLSELLYVYDARNTYGRQERILLSTLQGVVNSDKVQLFMNYSTSHMVEYDQYKFYTDLAVERYGYYKGYNGGMIDGIGSALDIFKGYLKTAVVIDTSFDYMLNLAVNLAAVKNAVVVTEAMLAEVQKVAPDVEVIRVSDLGAMDFYESQRWVYENCFPFMRRDIMGWQFWGEMFDWSRDFNIQMKIPTVWVAGRKSQLYDEKGTAFIGSVLQRFPPNIPVWGWPAEWVNGVEQGMAEVEGITFFGWYGKYMLGWDIVGNCSFFASMPVAPEALKVKNVVKPVAYDPDKIYVAIANADAGDAPCYTQYGFMYFEWGNEQRGKIPRSYEYAISNYTLNPLFTQYVFDTATDNDYLYAALTGLGYTWAFSGYGSKGVLNDSGVYLEGDDVTHDYFIKTNEMMGRMGFDSLEMIIYAAGTFWKDYDYEYFTEHMSKYLTNADFYLGDFMRLIDDIPKDSQNVLLADGKPMFHCSTRYSTDEDKCKVEIPGTEEFAVNWLTNDILTHTNSGADFYYCLAFTWHYGPDRSKLVMDRLKSINPNYEFVTTAQMYDLYRQRQALGG